MANSNIQITDDLDAYLHKVGMRETPEMAALRDISEKTLVNSQLAVMPHEAMFLAFLIRLSGAKRVIEIGVYAGYSTLAMAQALPKEGRIVAFERDARFPKVGRPYWQKAGVDEQIDLRLCEAQEGLEALLSESGEGAFDFVFIDADKAGYEAYYELSLKLVRSGGVICLDNVLWQGRVIDSEDHTHQTDGIRRINELIHRDERVHMSMLPAWDGLTLVQKR